MVGLSGAKTTSLIAKDLPEGQEDGPDLFLSRLYLPIGGATVLNGDPDKEEWLRARYGEDVRIVSASPREVLAAIERRFRSHFSQKAIRELATCEPQFSASVVITPGQIGVFAAIACLAAWMFAAVPQAAETAVTAMCVALFLGNSMFRALLLWASADFWRAEAPAPCLLADSDLPVYSILVPLYREANVMSALLRALRALDYPRDCLDIKLIVEVDDAETAAAADLAAAMDERFSVIRVPPGTPRTKPRACNYAMPFVLGEFTVIYDAEDRPEPDQLRKAVAAFRASPDSVACLQARLNFYNANQNWLTRMFALDYALWFDYLLRGLDRLNIPMPLGGTSNHFRTSALRSIHAWDPYNVTEDADLGIRLARVGLRVRVLDSTTFEEATGQLALWLRQRSRWMKGYMQTWLVHMRSPRALLRNAGFGGFVGFQLFIGGTFLTALINPVLWAIFLYAQFFSEPASAPSATVAHLSVLGLMVGNGLFAYLAMLSPVRRGWLDLAPFGLTAPIYWLLISCAEIRALFQLCTRPWHWDKTPHGLNVPDAAPLHEEMASCA